MQMRPARYLDNLERRTAGRGRSQLLSSQNVLEKAGLALPTPGGRANFSLQEDYKQEARQAQGKGAQGWGAWALGSRAQKRASACPLCKFAWVALASLSLSYMTDMLTSGLDITCEEHLAQKWVPRKCSSCVPDPLGILGSSLH